MKLCNSPKAITKRSLACLISWPLIVAPLWATSFSLQANPNVSSSQRPDAGSILRDFRNLEREVETLPSIERHEPLALTDDGQTVILRSVTFEGYQGLVSLDALNNLVADQIGQELGFNGLMALADLVTGYLATQGYFLSFAYLPEQDITEGDLIIAILPVRVEGGQQWRPNIRLIEGANIDPDKVAAILRHSMQDDADIAINAKNMERGLLILNDLHGLSAQSLLERGEEFGTTRVNVMVLPTPRYTNNVWIDNYGGFYTGDLRANGLFNINNLTGQGDRLSALISQTRYLRFSSLTYSTPVSPNGTMLNYSLSGTNYTLGNLDTVNLSGETAGFTLGFRYPIIRSRSSNLYISPEFGYSRLRDFNDNELTKSRIYNTFGLTLNGDRLDQGGLGGYTGYSINYKRGDLNLNGSPDDAITQDNLGPNHQGHFAKLNFDITRLQKISAQGAVYVKAQRQISLGGNLDSAETFSASGSSAVRAYAGGDASGDEGWLLNLEYRYDIPELSLLNGTFQLIGFYDHGMILINKKEFGEPTNNAGVNSYQIRGAGLELIWARAGQYSLKATYAHKIEDKIERRSTVETDSEGKNRSGRLWLQAMWWF